MKEVIMIEIDINEFNLIAKEASEKSQGNVDIYDILGQLSKHYKLKGDIKMNKFDPYSYTKVIYYRHGKKYRKLARWETIKRGAMQSWCHGELKPIMGTDTIGDVPSSFSDERDFYNPVIEQSWCHGELKPIMGTDTIGDVPSSFIEQSWCHGELKPIMGTDTIGIDVRASIKITKKGGRKMKTWDDVTKLRRQFEERMRKDIVMAKMYFKDIQKADNKMATTTYNMIIDTMKYWDSRSW